MTALSATGKSAYVLHSGNTGYLYKGGQEGRPSEWVDVSMKGRDNLANWRPILALKKAEW
jgi:hypothetical protein